MKTPNSGRAVIATATTSLKAINQDACACARNEQDPLSAVIVADGLGSHFKAEVASELAVTAVTEELLHCNPSGPIDFQQVFGAAGRRIADYIADHTGDLPNDLDRENSFGTTLLCAVETVGHVTIAYVGNGGALHIRGNFNTFPQSQLLPWTALNYLNPHTFPKEGKNVLYRYMSGCSPVGAGMTPTVLTINKDLDLVGDILVICSDGVHSYDQTPIGQDDDGNIWISGEPQLALLYKALNCFFEKGTYTDAALEEVLQSYLAQLQRMSLVHDDCTLGVIISGQALKFQQSRQPNNAGGIHEGN